MRAFIRLREILATHRDLAMKLEELERKYDKQFRVVFDAIRELMGLRDLNGGRLDSRWARTGNDDLYL